jgi:hypothetical protein
MNGLVDWLGGGRILPIGVPQRKHHAQNGENGPQVFDHAARSTTLGVRTDLRSPFADAVMTGRAELIG